MNEKKGDQLNLDAEGNPFETCLMCNEPLAEEVLYTVTKVYKNYSQLNSKQLLFEHAICMSCVEKSRAELSRESLQALEEYQVGKMAERMQVGDGEIDLNCCLFSRKAIAEEGEFGFYGVFQGRRPMLGSSPFAVGQTAMEEMQALLSQESRDTLDGFIDEFFSGPPELRALLKEKPVVLL